MTSNLLTPTSLSKDRVYQDDGGLFILEGYVGQGPTSLSKVRVYQDDGGLFILKGYVGQGPTEANNRLFLLGPPLEVRESRIA